MDVRRRLLDMLLLVRIVSDCCLRNERHESDEQRRRDSGHGTETFPGHVNPLFEDGRPSVYLRTDLSADELSARERECLD